MANGSNQSGFQNQIGPQSTLQDILSFGQGRAGNIFGSDPNLGFQQLTNSLFSRLSRQGASTLLPANQVGLATLLGNLMRQGRTDPQLFNRQVSAIDQGTQAQQQATQAQLARSGLTGSGVGQAISAIQGQGGEDRQAALRAQESAMAEQRKRQDLDQLLRFLAPIFGQISQTQNFENQQQLQDQAFGDALQGQLMNAGLGAATFGLGAAMTPKPPEINALDLFGVI